MTSAVDLLSPGMGSLFGELVAQVIPNLRGERVLAYLTKLARALHDARFVQAAHAERLDDLEAAFRDAAESFSPERLALFEEGAQASARATTDERIDRIVFLVTAGFGVDEREAAYSRELLAIADELSDLDVAFLLRFDNIHGREGRPLFGPEVNGERLLSMGEYHKLAPEVQRDLDLQKTFVAYRRERLAGLGLLTKTQAPTLAQRAGKRVLAAGDPVFTVTKLGRLLLKRMGFIRPEPTPHPPASAVERDGGQDGQCH